MFYKNKKHTHTQPPHLLPPPPPPLTTPTVQTLSSTFRPTVRSRTELSKRYGKVPLLFLPPPDPPTQRHPLPVGSFRHDVRFDEDRRCRHHESKIKMIRDLWFVFLLSPSSFLLSTTSLSSTLEVTKGYKKIIVMLIINHSSGFLILSVTPRFTG